MCEVIYETNIVKNLETVHKGEEVLIAFFKENYPCKFGIFDDYAAVAETVSDLDEKGDLFMSLHRFSKNFKNNIQRNKLFDAIEFGSPLKDEDIEKYNYFFIGIDPVRYTDGSQNCSTTYGETVTADIFSSEIMEFLSEKMGFPKPIIAFSGNGYHLLYKVDIEASEENKMLLKQCLNILDILFNHGDIRVDTKGYNPSCYTKLYGVYACKGIHTEKRPHRRSGICLVPTEEVVSIDKIRNLSKFSVKKYKPVAEIINEDNKKEEI